MKSLHSWTEQSLSSQIIPELKELQQIQEFALQNYMREDIDDLLPIGIELSGIFIPIAFPVELSVSYTVSGPAGSDTESWSKDYTVEYFEENIILRLNKIDTSYFSKNFKNQLLDTFGYSEEEYNELPPEEKVFISSQVLIDMSLNGELHFK